MKKVFFSISIVTIVLLVFISCKKDDNQSETPTISVNQTVIATSTLSDSPTIKYKDATGTSQTEVLSIGTWSKSLTVNSGFKLLLNASGKITDGTVSIKVTATGNGNNYNVSKSENISGKSSDFDLTLETTLN